MALTHLIQYANHVSEVTIAADLLARLTTLTDTPALTVRVAVQELLAFADWRPGLIERTEHHLAAARILRPDAAALNIGGAFEIAQTRLLWMRGRWDEVLALIRTASVDLEQRGVLVPAQLLLCVACEVLVDRGDLDEAAGVANRFVTPIETLTRNSALARARLRHAVGDRAGAYDLLTLERERAAGGGSVWKLAEVLRELVDVLIADQRTAEARDVATELEFVAGRTGWPECRVPALRARAIVDRDVDAARAYAELAKTEHWEVQQAHAALVLGELNDDPGQNLTLAYQLFDSYGATPLRRRAAAGLRARGRTVPRRRVAAHSVLTETEEQLIRLVVGGYSNREIATALHYSTKTIEVYLSRVYAKTGCASRLELIRGVDTGAVLGDS
jgi:DNA-binding CsgD family transcriptional regulator